MSGKESFTTPFDNADTDADDLPDAWEVRYGLNVGINDADGDPDGDGFSNLNEFRLGTHPGSGNSFFKATLAPDPADPGSYQLNWNSVIGEEYRVEWSPDLVTPFTGIRNVTATGVSTIIVVERLGNVGFFRVTPQP